MLPSPHNLYHQLRIRLGAVRLLSDSEDSPPERLMQAVWQHQRLLRDQLKTSDGRKLTVLHPGFWSYEGGPDFQQALIQFDDEAPVQGDVEVDVRSGGWRAHKHHTNKAFANVILHVVWQEDGLPANGLPELRLRPFLDSSPGELAKWLGSEGSRELPAEWRGKCCAPLRSMEPRTVDKLLLEAAEVRLAAKGAWFAARARQTGWEQALWEGLFRALGYKHNSWPMQRLAELRPRWIADSSDIVSLQGRMFGISGLLPADIRLPVRGGAFARQLWDVWWRDRDSFADCVLPREAWRMHGLRPANHPQRRLALAAHWCAGGSLPRRLEEWCANEISRPSLAPSLAEALKTPSDEFWSWHWTFKSARMSRPQPLLGQTRVTDLAVNVILPWLAVRAVEGKNQAMLDRISQRYFAWPAAEDNSVLRLARQRLLGSTSKKPFASAASQQGLIQIVRDFCEHSNSICDKCRLPDMARDYASRQSKPEGV